MAILEWAVSTLTLFAEAATGNLYYDPALYQQTSDQFEDSMDHNDHVVVSDHEEQEANNDYEHEGK